MKLNTFPSLALHQHSARAMYECSITSADAEMYGKTAVPETCLEIHAARIEKNVKQPTYIIPLLCS